MAQVKGVTFKVGGKTYVQESPTFEQEMFIMEQATAAGLDTVALELTPDQQNLLPAIKRLLITAYKKGALWLLMAALVTEEGEEWSEEAARVNADIFRRARSQEDKEALRPVLVGALMAFFESGASLSLISSISSVPDLPDDVDSAVSAKPKKRNAMTPEQAGALFGSAHTDRVSAKSRSTSGRSRKTSSP